MNKYLQLINANHIKADQEFTTLSALLTSVGLPRYENQLNQMKQEMALKQVLADKGLTYKKVKPNSFKVVIVTL